MTQLDDDKKMLINFILILRDILRVIVDQRIPQLKDSTDSRTNGPPSIQDLYTILKGSLDISSHTSSILTA